MPGAHACTHGSAPASRIASITHAERGTRLGRVHRPVPAEAGRGRDRPVQHRRQRRLVELHHPAVDAGHAAPEVGQVAAYALGERLRELAPGAVVGEHQVAARPLDRRRERPGADDLGLERAGERPATAPRPGRGPGPAGSAPAAGRAPPSRSAATRRAGGRTPGRGDRHARPAMRRRRARGRAARGRRAGPVGQLAEHDPDRLGVRRVVVARMGPDARSPDRVTRSPRRGRSR